MLIGKNRIVQYIWYGNLSFREERLVNGLLRKEPIDKIMAQIGYQIAPRITEKEFEKIKSDRSVKVNVLDIRFRSDYESIHRPNAINLPADEISSRAARELNKENIIVIDCSSSPALFCTTVARRLSALGFSKVTILGPGLNSSPCSAK